MNNKYKGDICAPITNSENGNCRYIWMTPKEEVKDIENRLLIIMMNPSNADENGPDRTISKMLKWNEAERFDKVFASVKVMNISPLVETNSKKALNDLRDLVNNNDVIEDRLKENFSQLANAICKVDNIIIAWGNIGDQMLRMLLNKYQKEKKVKDFVKNLKTKVCSNNVKYLEINGKTNAFRHPRFAWIGKGEGNDNSLRDVNKQNFSSLFDDYK
ncbi:DUF1643 domain-containing protein [Listeria monocytogenes]